MWVSTQIKKQQRAQTETSHSSLAETAQRSHYNAVAQISSDYDKLSRSSHAVMTPVESIAQGLREMGLFPEIPATEQSVAGAWWIRTTLAAFEEEVRWVVSYAYLPGVHDARVGRVQKQQPSDPDLVVAFSHTSPRERNPEGIGISIHVAQFDDN
jgi:hypothetical protein